MVEKYRGLIPSNSTWFHLSRAETIQYLIYLGQFDQLTPEQLNLIDFSEIQGLRGKISKLEEQLKQAGLDIITLFE